MVISTAPDEAVARDLARRIVSERLAACVTQVPGVRSTYFWEGKLEESAEVLLLFKTTAEQVATLSARIESLHPYDVPEVVAIGIDRGSERYLAWVGQSAGPLSD